MMMMGRVAVDDVCGRGRRMIPNGLECNLYPRNVYLYDNDILIRHIIYIHFINGTTPVRLVKVYRKSVLSLLS